MLGWGLLCPESLRYLSLHDNQYLRYFRGHRDKVVSLAMVSCSPPSVLCCGRQDHAFGQITQILCAYPLHPQSPKDDNFMSASLDQTVRLWDLRQPNCKVPLQQRQPSRVPGQEYDGLLTNVPGFCALL